MRVCVRCSSERGWFIILNPALGRKGTYLVVGLNNARKCLCLTQWRVKNNLAFLVQITQRRLNYNTIVRFVAFWPNAALKINYPTFLELYHKTNYLCISVSPKWPQCCEFRVELSVWVFIQFLWQNSQSLLSLIIEKLDTLALNMYLVFWGFLGFTIQLKQLLKLSEFIVWKIFYVSDILHLFNINTFLYVELGGKNIFFTLFNG